MHPRAPTTAVYFSSPLPSISLLNRNQRNHDTQLCKTFPLQAQRRWFIRQNGQKIQMTIHFFHQLFLHFCQDWLADLTQSGWTKYKMCLNIKYKFWDAFLHCIKHITITIMTDLFFSTEKVVLSWIIWERFINFPATVQFGQKGFLCAAKRSFSPDCRVPDLEGKGLLWED